MMALPVEGPISEMIREANRDKDIQKKSLATVFCFPDLGMSQVTIEVLMIAFPTFSARTFNAKA